MRAKLARSSTELVPIIHFSTTIGQWPPMTDISRVYKLSTGVYNARRWCHRHAVSLNTSTYTTQAPPRPPHSTVYCVQRKRSYLAVIESVFYRRQSIIKQVATYD